MRVCSCVLLLLVSPLGFAADDTPLSIDEAVALALQSAPRLAGSEAGVEAAEALAVSAGRLPDPAIIVGIDNLPVNGPDAFSTTRDFMTMRKVGVMQTFPAAEKRRLQYQRARADADRADAELAQSQLDVAREAAVAWIQLAAASRSLDELRSLESEVDLGAAAARAAVAAGRSSSAEALSAEVMAARLRSRILQMQGSQRRAQALLAGWIGDGARRPLAALPSFDQLPVPADTLLASPHLHGDILPFESRIEAARTDLALARAERRPDWSAELSFGQRGPDFSDMISFELTVGLPLFTKYRQNPVIAARHAELRQLEAERDAEIRLHTAEIQKMVIEWAQLGEQLEHYERELIPLARERTQVALAAYRAGSGGLQPSLDAFANEIEILIDREALQSERGRAWAYLRFLQPEHLRQ
jgi:outer membrane protein, heavy metal efflux system